MPAPKQTKQQRRTANRVKSEKFKESMKGGDRARQAYGSIRAARVDRYNKAKKAK